MFKTFLSFIQHFDFAVSWYSSLNINTEERKKIIEKQDEIAKTGPAVKTIEYLHNTKNCKAWLHGFEYRLEKNKPRNLINSWFYFYDETQVNPHSYFEDVEQYDVLTDSLKFLN